MPWMVDVSVVIEPIHPLPLGCYRCRFLALKKPFLGMNAARWVLRKSIENLGALWEDRRRAGMYPRSWYCR